MKQQFSKEFLQKAIYKVGAIINKLESANKELSVGIDIAKSVAGKKVVEIVSIDQICMQGSIQDAVNSKIAFTVQGKIAKKQELNLRLGLSIDSKLWRNLARAVCEQTFTNSSYFGQQLSSAKLSLRDIDQDKIELLKDMNQNIQKHDIGEAKKKDVIGLDEEEVDFKKIAYMELPRYTLSNDGIIKFFSKQSPWSVIKTIDPLENAFLGNSSKRMVPLKLKSVDPDIGKYIQ